MVHTSRSKSFFSKHHGITQLRDLRLLVLRHGPRARLQGVAIVATLSSFVRSPQSTITSGPTLNVLHLAPEHYSDVYVLDPLSHASPHRPLSASHLQEDVSDDDDDAF
jgi:hypothetical protein